MTASFRFRWAVHALIVAAGLGTLALHAQTPARPAGGALITGGTSVLESKDLSVARRRFEAGARSYWHSHDNGQLLYVEAGRMWTQKRGQARREMGPGDSDYAGPNVVHWHGATPREHVIQVNVGFGGATKWLEEVTEAEYAK